MEQVKIALAWLKAHHFWVLSVIVVGLTAGVWYTASASLASDFEANKKKIDGEFKSQTSLRGKPFKPNDRVNETQRNQTREMAESVEQVWRSLYGAQEEEVLIWPSELGGSFATHMEGKTFGDEIGVKYRDRYLNYIQKRFPELVKIIDAEELVGSSGGRRGAYSEGGSRRPRRGARAADSETGELEPEETYLVEWLDQETLRARMELAERPAAIEIWVLQEDLWVYETLLKQIAKTNEASGATRSSRAPIRTIFALQVGRDAAGSNASTGRIQLPGDSGGATGGAGAFRAQSGGEMYDDEASYSRSRSPRSTGGMGDEFGPDSGADLGALLMAGRYIDPTGQPIVTAPPDYRFGTEFKRLPVRMELEMDQRWISQFIVNLATAPLQVEVEQVRFNPDGATSGGGRRSRRSGARSGGGGVEAFDRDPSVGTVILHGAVYMFNEPNEAILSVDDDNDAI